MDELLMNFNLWSLAHKFVAFTAVFSDFSVGRNMGGMAVARFGYNVLVYVIPY